MRQVMATVCILAVVGAYGMAAVPPQSGLMNGVGAAASSSVKSELLADTKAIAPGKPFTLAVVLTTSPGWHIYWTNPGESGLSTTFQLQLPPGFKAEPPAYPIPMTFIQPGGIKGYGYTGRTAFLFRVTPPESLTAARGPGDAIAMWVAASWLCCNKDQCVPGNARLPIALRQGTVEAANGEIFAAARDALPAAFMPKDITARMGAPVVAGADASWRLEFAFKDSPQKVEAYPENVEGLAVTSLKTELDQTTARVSLVVHRMGGQALKAEKLPLLIVYTTSNGKRQGFYSDVKLDALLAQ